MVLTTIRKDKPCRSSACSVMRLHAPSLGEGAGAQRLKKDRRANLESVQKKVGQRGPGPRFPPNLPQGGSLSLFPSFNPKSWKTTASFLCICRKKPRNWPFKGPQGLSGRVCV